MPTVNVAPAAFELVNFDAREIESIAAEIAAAVGLPSDCEIDVDVDETEMVVRSSTTIDGRRIVVAVSGGAFESQRKAREFAPDRCRAVLGQALMRARDRLDPAFGAPGGDEPVGVRVESAWSTYIEGRLERLGVAAGRPQRRLYHFRVRHGFNDTVDAVFQRLWQGADLTWADLERASDEAASAASASAAAPR